MSILAQSIGEFAQALLKEGQSLGVFARTSQVLFLQAGGEVVWIGRGPVRHRRALLVGRLPDWPEGLVLNVQGDALVNGSREPLRFGGAARWSPPAPPRPPQDLPRRASALTLACARHFESLRQTLGASRLDALQEALRLRDGPGLGETARDLVGYGPGLTPLGDDLLGGVLFALRVAQQTWAEEGRPALMAWAQGRTSRLSLALLSDLSQGHGPEPLHALVLALFGGSLEGAAQGARDILALGHTTGVALLFGALLAWSALG